MDFDFLNGIDWKKLLNLNEHQNQAIERALCLAKNNDEIARLLREDFERLENGVGKIGTPEEERRRLYGEELYRMHPVLVLMMRLPWLLQKYQAHSIPERVLIDTLSDIRIWMNVCEKKTGHPGLLEY